MASMIAAPTSRWSSTALRASVRAELGGECRHGPIFARIDAVVGCGEPRSGDERAREFGVQIDRGFELGRGERRLGEECALLVSRQTERHREGGDEIGFVRVELAVGGEDGR